MGGHTKVLLVWSPMCSAGSACLPHLYLLSPQGLTGPIGPPGPAGANGEKVSPGSFPLHALPPCHASFLSPAKGCSVLSSLTSHLPARRGCEGEEGVLSEVKPLAVFPVGWDSWAGGKSAFSRGREGARVGCTVTQAVPGGPGAPSP